MRFLLLSCLATVFLSNPAKAVPLSSGTLADYVSLGATGGTIGGTLFSDFMLLPAQAGATLISPNDILINPIHVVGNPGLSFVLNQTANASQLLEMRISYRLSDPSIFGASVELVGSSVSMDGANTGVLGISDVAQSLIAFDLGGVAENPVSMTFNPLSMLSVEFDLVVDGGLSGRAILASATNQFSVSTPSNAVPEPSSIAILGLLMGSLTTRLFSRRRRKFPL
jgi:PEP-CTERM motif